MTTIFIVLVLAWLSLWLVPPVAGRAMGRMFRAAAGEAIKRMEADDEHRVVCDPAAKPSIIIAVTRVEIMVIWADPRGGDVHLCAVFPRGAMAAAEAAAAAVAYANRMPVTTRRFPT